MDSLKTSVATEYKRLCDRERSYMAEIESLPLGYIQKKTIKGKEYYYLQYREGKKIRSVYIKKSDYDSTVKKINRRRELESEIADVRFKKDALERAFDKDALMIAVIQESVHRVVIDYPEISKVVLFGSRAESRYRDDSDVDLLFESSKPVSLMRQTELRLRLEDEIGLSVDLIHGPLRDDTFMDISSEVEVYAA